MAAIIVGHHYSTVNENGRSLNYEVLSVDGDIVKVRDGSSVIKEVPARVFLSMDDSFMGMADEGSEEAPAPAE